MRVEFKRRERITPVPAIGVSQQHVGAKAYQGADRVRFSPQNGPVEITRGDASPARRAEGTLGEAQSRGHVLCRRQFFAGDRC